MACESCIPRKLQEGKIYDFSILYNHHEGPASERDKDQTNSYNVLKFMEKKLNGLQFTKLNYFNNFDLGSSIFTNLLTMIEVSERVIIILTEGYMENLLTTFAHQNNVQVAVKEGVLNCSILPVAIGLSKKEVIKLELGLETANVLFFESDWENDTESWGKLTEAFVQNSSFSTIRRPVEEIHDAKSLAEDGAPATGHDVPNINNSGASSGIKGAARPLILHGGASATGQEVSNTNKPSGALRGTAESAIIYQPVGVTKGLSRNTPTIDVNSNPTGPRGNPVGAAATGLPDLQLPPPTDTVDHRAPSTPETNARTSPDNTEPDQPPTLVLPGYPSSIHIRERVHQDTDNPAEQKKSPYYMDAFNYIFGNF